MRGDGLYIFKTHFGNNFCSKNSFDPPEYQVCVENSCKKFDIFGQNIKRGGFLSMNKVEFISGGKTIRSFKPRSFLKCRLSKMKELTSLTHLPLKVCQRDGEKISARDFTPPPYLRVVVFKVFIRVS